MSNFNHGAFMRVLRGRWGSVPAQKYQDLMAALDAGLESKKPKAKADEPAWLVEARSHLGLREVRGKRHNATILRWVKALGGWFTDDETPWCGTFAAICMKTAGHSIPQHWYRARAWGAWGQECKVSVGAVAVFGRKGGGHVGFIVGQNADSLYILGGNQSNMVNVMPIARARLLNVRWPSTMALPTTDAPTMHGGTHSRNEA